MTLHSPGNKCLLPLLNRAHEYQHCPYSTVTSAEKTLFQLKCIPHSRELAWFSESAEQQLKKKINLCIHLGTDVHNRKTCKFKIQLHPSQPSFPFLSLFSPEAMAHAAEPMEKSTCLAASARHRTRISASAADNGGGS